VHRSTRSTDCLGSRRRALYARRETWSRSRSCRCFSGETQSRFLEEKDATCAPFCLARNPKANPIPCDEKGRDRLAENVDLGPRWKFEQSVGCCGWFVFIDSYFIAAYDGANAMQRLLGKMNGAKVCCLAFHNQPRVPVIGETLRPVSPDLCTSRRHRANSRRERRNMTAGTARLLRSAKCSSGLRQTMPKPQRLGCDGAGRGRLIG
jgi:hypothetical protein